jgi:hypothetical protein
MENLTANKDGASDDREWNDWQANFSPSCTTQQHRARFLDLEPSNKAARKQELELDIEGAPAGNTYESGDKPSTSPKAYERPTARR